MKKVLDNLTPKDIFYYFEEISNIPRGSSNEKAISDYMVAFAKAHQLEVKQDELYNIYIKKPATPGYEDAPTVILQGHLDMVCEKNKDTVHDFTTDPLALYVDGDFIRAKGTTLGADNGIAIAYQLAVLADNSLEHPAIEAFMTSAEETGMFGVAAMHPEYLDGKVFLNLDTDIEGEFLVSCAGGKRATITLPIEKQPFSDAASTYKITVKGLKGGHSGADIHHERANANKVLARLLKNVSEELQVNLLDFQGGSKDNVITREAEAVIAIPSEQADVLDTLVVRYSAIFKEEYSAQDGGITIEKSNYTGAVEIVSTIESSKKCIDLLTMLPNGVVNYSQHIKGLVETSLNMGVVKLEADHLHITFSIRSSVATKKEAVAQNLAIIAQYVGATIAFGGDYPAWAYKENSKIRDLASTLYEEMYHTQPSIKAIHAGLECGFILEKLPHLDMIAFGPNVYDIHSPDERASISSMSRVYDFLCTLLKRMKEY